MSDTEKMFDEFADATELKLSGFAEQIRAFRAELAQAREEQRSAPVITPQPAVDIDALATRAALLVPAPVIDINAIAKQAADLVPVPVDGKDGKDGKDAAEVNVEEIVAQVAEAAIPRITAAIPAPAKGDKGDTGADGKNGIDGAPGGSGTDGINGRDGLPGEMGVAGKDGIATRDEIEAIVERQVADMQVRTFADLYQGVFKPGDAYTRGLAATWDGSLWLSLRDNSDRPGTTDAWKLIVKKGADGKR